MVDNSLSSLDFTLALTSDFGSGHQLVVDTLYKLQVDSIKDAYLQLSKKVNRQQVEYKRSLFTDELRQIKERIMECRRHVSKDSTEEAVHDLKYWKTNFVVFNSEF